MPQIISVKGRDGLEIDEGLYREIGIGEDWLRVTCSETVTSLCAYPSHLSLMDDDDVTVEKIATGEFLVRMHTAKVTRRSRMILTLAATDCNGTTVYRDVSLRFDAAASVEKLDRWRKLDASIGKPLAAFTFDKSNTENSGTGSMEIGWGNVSYVESPLGCALYHNDDDGPWITSDRSQDMPNEWTVLTMARLSEVDNAVLYQFGSSEYEHCGFAIASGGKDRVTLSYWSPHERHTDLLTINVPNAFEQYHTYALRAKGRTLEMFVDGISAGSATLPSMPKVILQIFSIIAYSGNTGLVNAKGEYMDDWRMYDVALPDTAIVAYANTLLMFDQARAGIEIEDVVVPERWFKKYYTNSTMSKTALSLTAANGRSVWECYVAGLDPTDKDDDLVADITFKNGVPKVSIAKGEKSNRIYRIYATKSLDGLETPLDVTKVPDLSVEPYGDYRFFRISAELP